jgi:hypothetical protein
MDRINDVRQSVWEAGGKAKADKETTVRDTKWTISSDMYDPVSDFTFITESTEIAISK